MINDIHMRPPASVFPQFVSRQLPVGGFVVDVDVDRRWLAENIKNQNKKQKQVNEP